MTTATASLPWLRDVAARIRDAAASGGPLPDSLQRERRRFGQSMWHYHRAAQHVTAVCLGLPIRWRRYGAHPLHPSFAVHAVPDDARAMCAESIIMAWLAGPHAQRRVLGDRAPLPPYVPEYERAARDVVRLLPTIDSEAATAMCTRAERRLSRMLSQRWTIVSAIADARFGADDGITARDATRSIAAALSPRMQQRARARRAQYARATGTR